VAAHWLHRTWPGVAGRPRCGGAGGMEELREVLIAKEAAAWRSRPNRAAREPVAKCQGPGVVGGRVARRGSTGG
jgi:hypothetical protein